VSYYLYNQENRLINTTVSDFVTIHIYGRFRFYYNPYKYVPAQDSI
jgi:hypothetical protein